MNKEFLVVLLEKDIRELELLTEGFEDLVVFPKPILQLARQKAENIIENLKRLEEISSKNEAQSVERQEIDLPNVETNIEIRESKEDILKQNTKEDIEIGERVASQILDEDEPEIAEKIEPVEFVEDIKDYGIQNKEVGESDEADEITEEETAEVNVEDAVQEHDEKINISQDIKTESPIVIKTETEELDNSPNSVNENIKIDDIRNAINIGDRFRFQRELFGGNGELMNRIIAYLNQLQKYDEAVSFLNNKFSWSKENQHAEDFLQIVRRRYL